MTFIICEVNLMLTSYANGVIVSSNNENQIATFAIPDTKLYVPVTTLSQQDNAKLLINLVCKWCYCF